MATYNITAAISGKAFCSVEADSEAEAIEKAKAQGSWEIDEWDLDTEPYRGGFIDAELEQ
jgi:hypothetical protein